MAILETVNRFVTREISIYYPYFEDVPYELLKQGGIAEERLANVGNERFIRVAKHEDDVIGVYLMSRPDEKTFALDVLAVDAAFQRRGLGRWLVGHAIGVAESKGGREVRASAAGSEPLLQCLLQPLGFEKANLGWVLRITPE